MALGLQENLVAVAVAEADDLILDRGAITRAGAFDLPGIHRRAVHIGPDQLVGCGRGASDAAFDLRGGDFIGEGRTRLGGIIAGLPLDGVPVVSRSSVKPICSMEFERPIAGASSMRPAGQFASPRWMIPRRNVPVVMTTAPQANSWPSASRRPLIRPSSSKSVSASPSITVRWGSGGFPPASQPHRARGRSGRGARG